MPGVQILHNDVLRFQKIVYPLFILSVITQIQIVFCDIYNNYLLTHSMVQIPSWEANWFAASQEIPRISWNPKVHYRTHKRPPPVSILGQPNPIHKPTSHLLEIHSNTIHPSTPRSPQWSPHPYAPHAQPISFFSILSPAQYCVRSIDHSVPRYAISSIPPQIIIIIIIININPRNLRNAN